MNPLKLFDYVFYSIAILYDRVWNYTEAREEIGIIFVGLLQWANVLFLIEVFNIDDHISKKESAILLLLILLLIVGLNFIRYKKYIKFEILTTKFDNQKRTVRYLKITLVIIYVFLSFAVFGLLIK